MEAKYVVYKVDDFAEIRRGSIVNESLVTKYAITDCMVIRFQDIFAAAALNAYASAILTAIEILEASGNDSDTGVDLSALLKLADTFHDAARTAESWGYHKIPD